MGRGGAGAGWAEVSRSHGARARLGELAGEGWGESVHKESDPL